MNNQCLYDDVTTQSDNGVEQFDRHWSVHASIHAVIFLSQTSQLKDVIIADMTVLYLLATL